VADVEVGLGAVVGDEDLAVLERVHRAGIDVEVGVELLHRDPQTAGLQQVAEAGGREALAEEEATPPVTKMCFSRGSRLSGGGDAAGRAARMFQPHGRVAHVGHAFGTSDESTDRVPRAKRRAIAVVTRAGSSTVTAVPRCVALNHCVMVP
jgi:hypothetical protein